jgi:hypothetical protein
MFSGLMVIVSVGIISYGLFEKSKQEKKLEKLKEDKELKKEIKICPADLKEEEKEKKIRGKLSSYKAVGYKEIKREVKDDGYLYITIRNSLKNKLENQIGNAKLTAIAGTVLLVIFGYFALSPSDNSKDEPSQPTKFLAYNYCKDFVKERLKNPADADFETFMDIDQIAEDLGDGDFIINAYVDATNGFGAKIRTRYKCEVKCNSDGCSLKQLKFFE